MLYVYPDNFIVPVIFVENFMSKKTYEKADERELLNKIEEIKETINAEKQENFRDDERKECYEELQKEFTMDWKEEGEYVLYLEMKKILSVIDEDYVCSETGKI